jgi:hypothetical protein
MQELVIFGACEKDASHSGANFILVTVVNAIHPGVPIIFEKRGKLVLCLDGESKVKWCSAVNVLNNWNFKGNSWFWISIRQVALFGCFKKLLHNALIIEHNHLRALIRFEDIVYEDVQSGLAIRENILGQL